MPSKKKKSAKRTTAEYLTAVKSLSPLHDKIHKLKRRKKLKPWEKGMITKVQKKLSGAGRIFSLNASQRRRLKNKGILISPTIHAVMLENTGENARAGVRDGEFYVTSSGRDFKFVHVDPDPAEYIAQGRQLFNSIPGVVLYFWHIRGRHTTGYGSIEDFTDKVIIDFAQYLALSPENWLLGIAYLAP